jgi:deoxyribonuclease-1-like protein
MRARLFTTLLLQIFSLLLSSQPLTLISWNIQDFGQTKSDETINIIAQLVKHADIVLIQEVVAKHPGGAQAVGRLHEALNRTGAKWDSRISDPTYNESPHKRERYAVLWKPSKLGIVGKHRLWSEKKDIFVREPHLIQFRIRATGQLFHVVNYHSRVHSDNPEEEIIHFVDLPLALSSDRYILAGDFNASESHPVFDLIYKMGFDAALKNTGTTLKRECKNGNYTNHAIDNIYYPKKYVEILHARLIDFVGDCSQLQSARSISDHLGVEIQFKWKGP